MRFVQFFSRRYEISKLPIHFCLPLALALLDAQQEEIAWSDLTHRMRVCVHLSLRIKNFSSTTIFDSYFNMQNFNMKLHI